MNLYELSARYQQLMDQDELSLEDCKELDALHGNIEDECINRGKYIRNIQAELDAVTTARKEMQEREKALSARIDRHEKILTARMQECNISKITKCPLFPVTLKKNPPSVDVYDETLIPQDYFAVRVTETKTLDKKAIKWAIDQGNEIPGATLSVKYRVDFK